MEKQTLSLLTLNIERSKHLERALPFLEEKHPDVCCIQELCEADLPLFVQVLGPHYLFEPMVLHEDDGVFRVVGIALFSRFPIQEKEVLYYVGEQGVLRKYEHRDQSLFNRVVLVGSIEKGGEKFQIGTTHFSWTPDGNVDDVQRRDFSVMRSKLDTIGDFVLCGDFNAPRGGEIFSELARRYTDNIPLEYSTSIDKTLHRAKNLEYMVDGIFSTERYKVLNVKMQCGLSDHCGFLADVTVRNS